MSFFSRIRSCLWPGSKPPDGDIEQAGLSPVLDSQQEEPSYRQQSLFSRFQSWVKVRCGRRPPSEETPLLNDIPEIVISNPALVPEPRCSVFKCVVGSLVSIGGLSDGAQTMFALVAFFKLFFSTALSLDISLGAAVLGGIVRFIQSCSLEHRYVKEGLQDFLNNVKSFFYAPKKSLKTFFHPQYLFPWLLGMLINGPGSVIAALGTIVGFLTVLPREVFALVVIVAGVDGLQTLFTEGSFLRNLLAKVLRNTTQNCAARAPETEDPREYFTQSTKSKLIWFFMFLVPGLLGAATEAGVSLLVWNTFLPMFSIERTLLTDILCFHSMGCRGLQNLALDGTCVSDFFAKMVDGKSSWKLRSSTKLQKAMVTLMGILGALMGGGVGYVGMQQIASSFLSNASLVTISCFAGVLRALQSVTVETDRLYENLSVAKEEGAARNCTLC